MAQLAVAPPFSRSLREGGDFDFRADDRFFNIKVPTLSPQKARRQGWGNPAQKIYDRLGQPPPPEKRFTRDDAIKINW